MTGKTPKHENKKPKTKQKELLETLKTENEELKAKHLRLYADFDNARKRMQKEKIDLLKYGTEDIILDFLTVMDNFDRAIDSVSNASDSKSVIEGIKMVQKQFHDALDKRGLKPLECKGKLFDINLHEAMTYIESDKVKEDHIIDEVQKGYMLGDKVIRYAKVTVAKKTV